MSSPAEGQLRGGGRRQQVAGGSVAGARSTRALGAHTTTLLANLAETPRGLRRLLDWSRRRSHARAGSLPPPVADDNII